MTNNVSPKMVNIYQSLKKSRYYGTHNIKNKWFKFVGDTEHKVTPSKGTRYTLACTLVYYHWT
jgi:hypothetical protein